MELEILKMGIKPGLIESALNWRYATKIFDTTKKIPGDKFEILLESLRLSPSSMGLQPWKFIIINNNTVRKELMSLSMQQSQMVDASHLIILCSLQNIDETYMNRLIELDRDEHGGYSSLEKYKTLALSYIESKSKEQLKEWMAEQVYIALGFLLNTCAMLEIDACPMEAFDHGKVNKLLDLHKHGIESRVAVALGYRSEKDAHAREKKLRWPKEEVFITI